MKSFKSASQVPIDLYRTRPSWYFCKYYSNRLIKNKSNEGWGDGSVVKPGCYASVRTVLDLLHPCKVKWVEWPACGLWFYPSAGENGTFRASWLARLAVSANFGLRWERLESSWWSYWGRLLMIIQVHVHPYTCRAIHANIHVKRQI